MLDLGGGAAPVEVKTYSRGDYFGELALLSAGPRAASVLARTQCVCLRISAVAFTAILGPETLERMRVEADRTLARRADIVNQHDEQQAKADAARKQAERSVRLSKQAGPQVVWDRRTHRYIRAAPNQTTIAGCDNRGAGRAAEVWSMTKAQIVPPTSLLEPQASQQPQPLELVQSTQRQDELR